MPKRPAVTSSITTTLIIALLAACGTSGQPLAVDPGAGPGPTVADPVSTSTVPAAGKGWIDGEPDWHGATEIDASAAGASGTMAAATADAAPRGVAGTAAPAGVAPISPTSQEGLRAGSVDDNADLAKFEDYLHRLGELGIVTRPFDAAGRIVVSVTGASGLPVGGVAIEVTGNGQQITTLRTTADGTARFLPALYAASNVQEFEFSADGVSATAAPGGAVSLVLDRAGGAQAPVALDVLFLLDATGSMGDEIDRLKATIDQVAARVASLDVRPDVRFAFTLYRDQGDVFVTSTFDFTSDVDAFREALTHVVADGGGDYPESMEEGFAAALSEPSWRDPASTVQLIFLVADAPPHVDRQTAVDYPASIVDAVSRGIKVFPIASSESDDQAEAVFRQIAEATGARFVFLSYGAQGAATGPSTDIASTDYEELALDQLVVRLIGEELAALTGTDPGIGTPTTVSTTNPPGQ